MNTLDSLLKEFRTKLLLRKYRIGHVKSDYIVDGMRVNRLYGLQQLIKENLTEESVVCEVGSYEGVSSELFALMCKTVYCVDIFTLSAYESVFDKMKSKYKNIIKIKSPSKLAFRKFKDNTLDFVYLDAGHEFKDINEDLSLWKTKVKRNGYIGGHDYHVKDGGVIKAVKKHFKKPAKIYSDSSWIVKK